MRSQFDDNGGGPDLSEVVADVRRTFQRNLRRLGPWLVLALIVVGVVLGVYKVAPGEQGVVRRFGKEHRKTGPGLHYRVPLMEKVDVVNIDKVRRIEVGVRGQERVPDEALMLTGDENIVEVQMIVQYRVAEPSKWLFRLRSPEETLQATAEVALRSMVGRTNIDDVLTTGREQVQAETRGWLQRLMDLYQSGIEVTEVKLRAVDAPEQVKDAFHAVTRAREEKEKLINEAEGYRADQLPRARGEARKHEREAEGYKEQRVLRANGDAAKFSSMLAEYKKAEGVTRQRLYYEMMEEVLGQLSNKVFVDKDLAKTALPVLPLGAQAAGAAVVGGGAR
jgi:membrane protease subunit HflK